MEIKKFHGLQREPDNFRQLYSTEELAITTPPSCFEAGLLVRDLDHARELRIVGRGANDHFSNAAEVVIDADFEAVDLPATRS